MQQELTTTEYEKLISYFSGFYEYDDEGNESLINPLTFRDADGDTTLHMACRRGDLWAVILLLKGGIDINSIGGMDMTPLHAVHRAKELPLSNREEIEKYLIDNGANLDIRDGFGLTPLQDAGENKSPSSTKNKWDCDKQ